MLVLTRRVKQTLMIGDPKSGDVPIEVEVVEVHGADVRIGVKAPRSVEVHRREIWDQKQAEKAAGRGGG